MCSATPDDLAIIVRDEMRKVLEVGTMIASILAATHAAFADYKKMVCVGEDERVGCPVVFDIMLTCKATEEDVGTAACTTVINGGKDKKFWTITLTAKGRTPRRRVRTFGTR